MARPRKAGKRTKSGRLQRAESTPREMDAGPTPELEALKAKVGGRDLGDNLSFIPLAQHQRQALTDFSRLTSKFFYGEPKTSSLSEMIGGSRAPHAVETEREREDWLKYKAANKALLAAGTEAHRTVLNLHAIRFHMGSLRALQAGAEALADFFGIQRERAA
jgi:hypothetical protein